MLAPGSQIGPITPDERRTVMSQSVVAGVYEKEVDRESAFEKLRERAARLIAELGGVGGGEARRLLRSAGGRVPVAVVMARRGLDADAAARALRAAGSLRSALAPPRR